MANINTSTTAATTKKYSYRWLRIGLLILLGLITPFSLFYLSYYNSSMAQQEVRFFRSLKELESAIDQTVSNLPSIHEKGLFSDIDSTENRKLFAQFNFLATQNKKLNSDIHSLEEKIAVETDRGSELIENNKSIGIGKKRQLESLYRQYSDTENSLFDYKKIVRQNSRHQQPY